MEPVRPPGIVGGESCHQILQRLDRGAQRGDGAGVLVVRPLRQRQQEDRLMPARVAGRQRVHDPPCNVRQHGGERRVIRRPCVRQQPGGHGLCQLRAGRRDRFGYRQLDGDETHQEQAYQGFLFDLLPAWWLQGRPVQVEPRQVVPDAHGVLVPQEHSEVRRQRVGVVLESERGVLGAQVGGLHDAGDRVVQVGPRPGELVLGPERRRQVAHVQ